MNRQNKNHSEPKQNMFTRRGFCKRILAASAFTSLGAIPACTAKSEMRKIKLGVVGCGGRGTWITGLFTEHGGYEIHSVADYFQEATDKCGDKFGVNGNRRFSGLSGYKRLIESGIEAVALETPPYFFPAHAVAAVDAGLHVYMAKPVAVDVPGSLAIQAAGQKATKMKRVFFVDYQIPTDPVNIKVVQAIHKGTIGPIAQVATIGTNSGVSDHPNTKTIESRLQHMFWINDIALSSGYIGTSDIHAIDAALWAIGQRPIAASGASRICRPDPHGDSHDVSSIVFEYENGVIHNHFGQAIRNNSDSYLTCKVFGQTANALINYWGKAYVRGGPGHCVGDVENLYKTGTERNIATFYRKVIDESFTNEVVQRSVDSVLTTILGREVAARHCSLTMDEVLRENKQLEADLSGLKS